MMFVHSKKGIFTHVSLGTITKGILLFFPTATNTLVRWPMFYSTVKLSGTALKAGKVDV
jgi:hypothetical protein